MRASRDPVLPSGAVVIMKLLHVWRFQVKLTRKCLWQLSCREVTFSGRRSHESSVKYWCQSDGVKLSLGFSREQNLIWLYLFIITVFGIILLYLYFVRDIWHSPNIFNSFSYKTIKSIQVIHVVVLKSFSVPIDLKGLNCINSQNLWNLMFTCAVFMEIDAW